MLYCMPSKGRDKEALGETAAEKASFGARGRAGNPCGTTFEPPTETAVGRAGISRYREHERRRIRRKQGGTVE